MVRGKTTVFRGIQFETICTRTGESSKIQWKEIHADMKT